MPREASIGVAYVPFKTFITALDTLNQGLPDVLDRSVFKNQSGSTQAMLMSTFRALGGIDDEGNTQPILRRLVNPNERKAALKEIVEENYRDVLSLGTNATQKQFDDAFYAYGVSGETHKKAKSFFLQVAEMLGIPLSPHIAQSKASSSGTRSAAPRKPRKNRKRDIPRDEDSKDEIKDDRGDSGRNSRLPDVVRAWIDRMPAEGQEWPRADFEKWLSMFKGSIELLYGIED